MKLPEAIELLRAAVRRERYSRHTLNTYSGWTERFFRWCASEGRNGRTFANPEERLAGFLSFLAPKVSASTQNQALCALVFFHKHCTPAPIGVLPGWVSARRPSRLPEWVTPREALALFERMEGPARMMAEIQFGSGLRLREVVNLRIKDVRLEEGTIVVRGGKGDKDRVTVLPLSLVSDLRASIARSARLFDDDLRDNVPGVMLPDDVGRKFPNYGTRWEWQWVFPSDRLSVDPETKIRRRHHFHPDMLNKAVRKACQSARLGRRVTSHAFRHGFATALLASGRPITEVADLLGHVSIQTTQRYLHCLPRLEERTVSPLDSARNVLRFEAPEASGTPATQAERAAAQL